MVVPFNSDRTTNGTGSSVPVSAHISHSNLGSVEPISPRVAFVSSKAREAGLILANPAADIEARVVVPQTTPINPSPLPEVHGLRAEMENLRREMREIQAERQGAPPDYSDL